MIRIRSGFSLRSGSSILMECRLTLHDLFEGLIQLNQPGRGIASGLFDRQPIGVIVLPQRSHNGRPIILAFSQRHLKTGRGPLSLGPGKGYNL